MKGIPQSLEYCLIKIQDRFFMDRARAFCCMIGGLMIVTSSMVPSIAEGTIEIFTLNSEIHPTDSIFVTGFVSTKSFYKPITLEIYDPNGKLLYQPHVNFNDQGQFSWLINPPSGKFEVGGIYTVIASHEDVKESAEIHFTVLEDNNDSALSTGTDSNDTKISSKVILNSYEFAETKPKIQDKKVSVKTTNLEVDQNSEIIKFMSSNGFIFVIPISLSVVIGILVIWNRTKLDKHANKNST